MDPATIFVIVMTAGALGVLAYLELKSRRQKGQAPPSAPPKPTAKPERGGPGRLPR